jgi:hypothetical protein
MSLVAVLLARRFFDFNYFAARRPDASLMSSILSSRRFSRSNLRCTPATAGSIAPVDPWLDYAVPLTPLATLTQTGHELVSVAPCQASVAIVEFSRSRPLPIRFPSPAKLLNHFQLYSNIIFL